MLTAEGCRERRQRLLDALKPSHPLVLADPIHLRYFANFHVEAISQHADFGGLLVIRPDGHAALYHDSKLPKSVEYAHADERTPVIWYSGQEPGDGPRQMLLRPVVDANGGRIHDSLADPLAARLHEIAGDLRRRKDPDEVALLRKCMKATAAGHAWARAHLKAGLLELAVYAGVSWEVYKVLGQWAVVYGDFTVSSGKKRGGAPTAHKLKNGETFILDYSVIVQGYRSDFTNTLLVGREPTPEHERLFGLCAMALEAGERELKAQARCQTVYDAVHGVFAAANVAEHFTTHAGHGIGAAHPEAPFIVRNSRESLVAGDVVTLEPGLYVGDIGIRLEHNYLITETGFERLSNHILSLV
jgi:Xaa-Pro aminopeptidase